MAKKHPWPSWILYDQAFREKSAWMPECCGEKRMLYLCQMLHLGSNQVTWHKYSIQFQHPASVLAEAGCWNCQLLEYSSETCPHKLPSKRARRIDPRADKPCKKYNERCSFSTKSKYSHKCLNHEAAHSLSQCSKVLRDHSHGNEGAARLCNNASCCGKLGCSASKWVSCIMLIRVY